MPLPPFPLSTRCSSFFLKICGFRQFAPQTQFLDWLSHDSHCGVLCIAHASIIACFCETQCVSRGSNYLILRIAEEQVGEQDITLVPKSADARTFFLNQVRFLSFHYALDATRCSDGEKHIEPRNSALDRSCVRRIVDCSSHLYHTIFFLSLLCYCN